MEDNNIKLNGLQKEILAGLFSANEVAVLESVEKMRNQGGVYSVKPMLEVYFSTPYSSVRSHIYDLICDIKDSKIADVLEKNIENYQDKEHFAKLLSSFWVSAIKFNELLTFLKIFDKGDSLVAVEILSIVEENLQIISDDHKKECYKFLKSKKSKYPDFKQAIAEDILTLLH